jgi:predicted RNase H-like nuclease (RuvC/YqgF family)
MTTRKRREKTTEGPKKEDLSKTLEEKNELSKELDEAYSAIEALKSELNEINLLNAKLLYTNKIFKSKNLNESQKVKVLSSFDKATTVGEVKMVFETLNEGIKVSKNTIKENLGSASKATLSPNVKKPIVESNDAFLRMQKLAGII